MYKKIIYDSSYNLHCIFCLETYLFTKNNWFSYTDALDSLLLMWTNGDRDFIGFCFLKFCFWHRWGCLNALYEYKLWEGSERLITSFMWCIGFYTLFIQTLLNILNKATHILERVWTVWHLKANLPPIFT